MCWVRTRVSNTSLEFIYLSHSHYKEIQNSTVNGCTVYIPFLDKTVWKWVKWKSNGMSRWVMLLYQCAIFAKGNRNITSQHGTAQHSTPKTEYWIFESFEYKIKLLDYLLMLSQNEKKKKEKTVNTERYSTATHDKYISVTVCLLCVWQHAEARIFKQQNTIESIDKYICVTNNRLHNNA